MAFNGKITLTDAGHTYLQMAQPVPEDHYPGAQLRATRLVMGDGILSATPPEQLTGVISPRITATPTEYSLANGWVTIKAIYSNFELDEPFYYRELGVYADQGPGTTEILYAYGNAGNDAELILPATDVGQVTKRFGLQLNVNRATNITMELAQGDIYVLQSQKATTNDLEAGTPDKWVDALEFFRAWVALRVALEDANAKIDSLNDLVSNNITTNQWHEDFSDISRIKLIRGNYNPLYQRLDCSSQSPGEDSKGDV